MFDFVFHIIRKYHLVIIFDYEIGVIKVEKAEALTRTYKSKIVLMQRLKIYV